VLLMTHNQGCCSRLFVKEWEYTNHFLVSAEIKSEKIYASELWIMMQPVNTIKDVRMR
jgi:hypothetical protein